MASKTAFQHAKFARHFGAPLVCLLLSALPLAAQDVKLTSRDGALSVAGNLMSYDGEFFRISSDVGPLTINASSVVCDGPACPDLTVPKAMIRITGDGEVGAALLAPVIAAFAAARGYDLRLPESQGASTQVLQPGTGAVLAEFFFTPLAPEAARSAMGDGSADLVVARFAPLDSTARILALDALVPIVAPDNPVARLSTADLAAILAGDHRNWSKIGGPDMPIALHGLDQGSDLAAALAARLGETSAKVQVHPDMTSLAQAVANDPWALAMTGRAEVGAAKMMPLIDSCGFALDPSPIAVKTDDYPLTLPIYLLVPPRRLPLMTREFLDFLAQPAAQEAIGSAGFVARQIETRPLAADGLRLINAIKAAEKHKSMPLLQRLTNAIENADRSSVSFRFEEGSLDLDLTSTEILADLAQHIASGRFDDAKMVLVGFVPGTGNSEKEDAEALALAKQVLDQLRLLAPDLPATNWPSIDAFGAGLPLACDDTTAGARLNRRVELWVRSAGP